MTQIGEQKFIRVQEIVSSLQNFQEGGPTDPKLNVSPPHHAPSVCQSSPTHSSLWWGWDTNGSRAAIATPLDYLFLLFKTFFFMCPQFSVLSSFCLLSSPKAETVAKQPAQHNTAALQLGSALAVPLWFQTIKYTGACECACTRSRRKCVWKVKAMNSFYLISRSQQSL